MTKNKQVKEVLSFLQKNRLDSIVLGVGALSLIGAITGIVLHSITLSKSVPAKVTIYDELVATRDADFEAQKEASIAKYGETEDWNIDMPIVNGTYMYDLDTTDNKTVRMSYDELMAESRIQGGKLNKQLFIDEFNKVIKGQNKDIDYKKNAIFGNTEYVQKGLIEVLKALLASAPETESKPKILSDFGLLVRKVLNYKTDFEYELDDLKLMLEKTKADKQTWIEYKDSDSNKTLSKSYEAFNKALVHDEELVLGKVVEDYGYHANKVVNSSIGLGLAGVAFIVLSLVLTSTAFKLWKKLRGGTKK